jgi:hypothetical protein
MAYPQIAALLNLILEYIMGKAHIEAEKKSQPLSVSQSHVAQ